jgi:ribonuclease P protein component
MLSRTERLSTAEFAEVFEKGRVLRHPLLQLRMMRRTDVAGMKQVQTLRAAFVAPKKLGKATVRNRLRRRVRERYRLLREESTRRTLLADCDLVWIMGATAATASVAEIDGALGALLRRAATTAMKNR